MKLTLRRLRWWLAPLVLVLLISVSITLTHVRHSRQMEAADVIAGIGGEVNVAVHRLEVAGAVHFQQVFFPVVP